MMPKKEVPPTPGATGAGADDINAMARQYFRDAGKASRPRAPAPWYRSRKADLRRQTLGLDLAEKGLGRELLDELDDRGEPLPVDTRRLAKRFGTTKTRMERMLNALVGSGLFRWATPNFLWSDYVADEIAYRQKISDARSKNASKGWEKTQRNQQASDANAYIEESREDIGKRGEPNGSSRRSATKSGDEDNEPTDFEIESVDSAPDAALDAPAGAASSSASSPLQSHLAACLRGAARQLREGHFPTFQTYWDRVLVRAEELDVDWPDDHQQIDHWIRQAKVIGYHHFQSDKRQGDDDAEH